MNFRGGNGTGRPWTNGGAGVDLVEENMNKCIRLSLNCLETIEKIDILSRSAASIKKTSMSIKTMMQDDEALVADIDKGLIKN